MPSALLRQKRKNPKVFYLFCFNFIFFVLSSLWLKWMAWLWHRGPHIDNQSPISPCSIPKNSKRMKRKWNSKTILSNNISIYPSNNPYEYAMTTTTITSSIVRCWLLLVRVPAHHYTRLNIMIHDGKWKKNDATQSIRGSTFVRFNTEL